MPARCVAGIAIVLLSASTVRAQEDAGVEGLEAPPTEPAPPSPAGGAEQGSELGTLDVMQLDPSRYSRRDGRLIHSKQVRLERLGDAISREGWEYDAAKERRYQTMIVCGAILQIGGAVSLVFSLVNGVLAAFGGLGCGADGCSGERIEEEERRRTTAWVLLSTGIAEMAVGIPLTVVGVRGRKRQRLLKSKDEILEMSPLAGISVAFLPSRDGLATGFSFSMSF